MSWPEDKEEGRLPRLACFVCLMWRESFSRQEDSFTSKKKNLKKEKKNFWNLKKEKNLELDEKKNGT